MEGNPTTKRQLEPGRGKVSGRLETIASGLSDGEATALEQLTPLVYAERRRIARRAGASRRHAANVGAD